MGLSSKFFGFTRAPMFAAGLLTPERAQRAQVWEGTRAVAGSETARAGFEEQRVVLVCDTAQDWTAWGGVMRGIEK
jgi:hypothetical protein